MDLKRLLIPTKESRHGTFFALLLAFIAVRSMIEVFTNEPSTTTYVLVGVTAILTITYGLLRFVEVFNAPGLSVRYFVRSVNITFMVLILLGEFFIQDMMGQMLLILSLLAIEFNLISIYAEYTGRLTRTKLFLMRLLHIKPKFSRPPNIRKKYSKWDLWAWNARFLTKMEHQSRLKRLDPLHEQRKKVEKAKK
jgi:hypothetical protein